MTTVETRPKAARVLDLRVEERVLNLREKKQDLVADLEGKLANRAVSHVLHLLLHRLGLQRLEGRILSLNWSFLHMPSFDESQIGKI